MSKKTTKDASAKLKLEKQTIKDMDVPKKSRAVKGGALKTGGVAPISPIQVIAKPTPTPCLYTMNH